MRILVFGLSSNKGGVESFLINYCKAILDMRPDIIFDFLVIDEIPECFRFLESSGCRFHVVPNRISHPIRYVRGIDSVLGESEYDAVWYNACTLSDATLLQKAKGKVPLRIVHAHSSSYMGNVANRLLHDFHKRYITQCANGFFACSEDAARFMYPRNVLNEGRVEVVPNGIQTDSFRFDSAVRNRVRARFGWLEQNVVIYVGRLNAEKNPLFAVKVYEVLKSLLPSTRLVLVGDGPLREDVKKDISDRNLEKSISVLGSRSDVNELMMAADMFIMPSVFEGFGLSFVEAQASGLICAVSSSVPDAAFLTETSKALPLDCGAAVWADYLANARKPSDEERRDASQLVARAGYDIRACANRLAQAFDAMVDRRRSDDAPSV